MKNRVKDFKTKHHLIPKERIKDETLKYNFSDYAYPRVLRLWRSKHNWWHLLFGNLTLEEIILVLQRIERMKTKDTS